MKFEKLDTNAHEGERLSKALEGKDREALVDIEDAFLGEDIDPTIKDALLLTTELALDGYVDRGGSK